MRFAVDIPRQIQPSNLIHYLLRKGDLLDSVYSGKHYYPMSELDQLLANIEQARNEHEAQSQWQPSHFGNIDIRIQADGKWFHEGRPFRRQALVKLFASVLCREGDDYFLRTPAEKLKIQVDDVPFVATMIETFTEKNQSVIVFTTNLGDRILLDDQHPIRIDVDQHTQSPRPYIHYHDGIEALISRSAFFDLINLANESERDGKLYLNVSSMGQKYELGCADPLETI